MDLQASGDDASFRTLKHLLEKECSITIARARHIYQHYCAENSVQPPPQTLQRAITAHNANTAFAPRPPPAPPFNSTPRTLSNHPSNSGTSHPAPYQGLRFHPTPFYSVLQTLSNVATLNENWGRQSVASLRFKMDHPMTRPTLQGQTDATSPLCPCLFVTSSENALLSYQPNSPGVTVEYPRLHSAKVDGRYIEQKMVAVVVGIQKFTVEELLDQLCRDRFVAKDQIVEQLQSKDGDDEISATTNVLSLTCPLSYIRIEHPCRSSRCNHLQCFDAKSYLQMNELTPTWMCPICSQPADFDGLMIDGYSQDIIKKIPTSESQVYVDNDFKWQLPTATETVAIGTGEAENGDMEIKSLDLTNDDGPSVSTPSKRKTHESSPNHGTPQRGSKAARVQIIDLTLSDSDESTAPSEPVLPPTMRPTSITLGATQPLLPVIDQAAYDDAFGLPSAPTCATTRPTLPPIAINPSPTNPLIPMPFGSVSETAWWRPADTPQSSSLSSPTTSFSSSPIMPHSPSSGNI
ncbi:E3 SUMO-protein ligase pli1 [Dimargaris verticillata]|uniref:E3 SUMO-protein ligase pli1 n=1 Tax=Dimargaris verticillata TaxID=2761393 RepID=A0A9W8EA97_9FUNG|nr:E3 SUMO-protein ligase pli1 [Dimargaris verticillata]